MGQEERALILSVNAGSSSLKVSVFAPSQDYEPSNPFSEPVSLVLTSSFENLTTPPTLFSFSATQPGISDKKLEDEKVDEITDHETAFEYFVRFLAENTKFDKKHIKHNVRALNCIEACLKILPESDSIAFFDSMFHSTIPDYIAKYAINQEIAGPKGLRKYGFHGLSYSYILRKVAAYLNKRIEQTSLVVMHLGSGASVCAIENGKSIDTSMGLTPLDGLPGATRSGHVDPSLIFHYTSNAARLSRRAAEPMEITEAEEILNREAGWSALAGTTDLAQISEREGKEEWPNETLAFLMFVDRILGYVGSYLLKLGGPHRVDALVFSGGVGEGGAKLRAAVLERAKCVGFALDEAKNEAVDEAEGPVIEIGVGAEGMKSLVCRTDEQLEMARQCSLQDQFQK